MPEKDENVSLQFKSPVGNHSNNDQCNFSRHTPIPSLRRTKAHSGGVISQSDCRADIPYKFENHFEVPPRTPEGGSTSEKEGERRGVFAPNNSELCGGTKII
ncbi:hypothetical protein GWI33_013102 [Rhynchophorus ferrugineus]|uniref:Uncharacterized protein n=1 Tax=Rhynchophorus ferrugineus TaxID=354439 RepID=A0A834I4D5_RHYFE|nr:hypothetical protein GWI33_013102 [Rhynchophorus ferrugineus]